MGFGKGLKIKVYFFGYWLGDLDLYLYIELRDIIFIIIEFMFNC